MTTTIVLMGHGPIAGLVRATLTDWSAAGLLAPFIWVDRTELGGPTTRALRIAGGLAHGCHVETELAAAGRLVRLGVLADTVTAPDGSEQGAALDLLRLCRRVRADAQVVPIRCLIGHRTPTQPVTLSLVGWHNLLISAEDSFDPRQGIVPLPDQPAGQLIGPAAAGPVASLLGLWQGMETACFDAVQVAPEQPVQLVRANVRIGEATELSAAMRQQTFDLQRVPAVRTPAGMTQYATDIRAATVGAADALWHHHCDKFHSGRLALPPQQPIKQGIGQSLKLFFSFLWAALRSAPQAWATGVVTATRGRVADWVHGLVYGQDSAFQVVTSGELHRLSAGELAAAMQGLDIELDRYEHRPQEAFADFSTLWQGYADGAMTLIDAGDRSTITPPVMIGTQRGTVAQVGQVVPGREQSFRPEANVRDATGVAELRCEDWLGQQQFAARLPHLRSQLGDEAVQRTAGQLQAWQRAHENSYAARLGALLGGRIAELTNEINAISAQLAAATQTDPDAEAERAQRRTAGWMRVITIVALVALVVTGVLFGIGVLVIPLVIGLGVGSLLSWLVGSVLVYLRGQRLFFQWLNRRRRAISEASVHQNNLRSAVRDGRQASEAYQQFCQWSRIIGAFLHRPFGAADPEAVDQPATLSGLPLAVALTKVSAGQSEQAAAVAMLRRAQYRAGWLGELWQQELAAVPGQLGPDAFDLQTQPALIFAARSTGPDSLLARWAELIESRGPTGAGAAQAWQRAVAGLSTEGESLFSRAVITTGGRQVPAAEFFDALADQAPGQPFDTRFLTAQAVLERAHFPQSSAWTQGFDSSWGRGVVRVEFTRPLRREAFTIPTAPESAPGGIQEVL